MDYLLHQRVMLWIEEAKLMLQDSLEKEVLVEEKRSPRDLVTEMDRKVEAFFVNKIQTHYPDHQIIGEEGTVSSNQEIKGLHWIIDPIDGTMNFVKQKNNFAIMVGIFQDGLPLAGYIYNVMANDLYYGIVGQGAYLNNRPLQPLPIKDLSDGLVAINSQSLRANHHNFQAVADKSLGVRYYGAAALEIIGVIRGELAAYLSVGLYPWDLAAGYAICQAMGMVASDLSGQKPSIFKKTPMVFARPAIQQEIIALLK